MKLTATICTIAAAIAVLLVAGAGANSGPSSDQVPVAADTAVPATQFAALTSDPGIAPERVPLTADLFYTGPFSVGANGMTLTPTLIDEPLFVRIVPVGTPQNPIAVEEATVAAIQLIPAELNQAVPIDVPAGEYYLATFCPSVDWLITPASR